MLYHFWMSRSCTMMAPSPPKCTASPHAELSTSNSLPNNPTAHKPAVVSTLLKEGCFPLFFEQSGARGERRPFTTMVTQSISSSLLSAINHREDKDDPRSMSLFHTFRMSQKDTVGRWCSGPHKTVQGHFFPIQRTASLIISPMLCTKSLVMT